jgi:hypothetical protein
MLKIADARRHIRLDGIQLCRRTVHVPVSRDGLEYAELEEVHIL